MTVDTSEVDAEIQDTENELSRQTLIRRLLIAALINLPLIITVIISLFIRYRLFAKTKPSDAELFGLSTGLLIVFFGTIAVFVFGSELYRQRDIFIQLKTQLQRLRSRRKDLLAGSARSRLSILIRYKNDLPELVDDFRLLARKYRRVHNLLQIFVIGGSLGTSSIIAAFGNSQFGRGAAIIGTLTVSASAAYAAYFKFKEKSFNLQRTADEIECEHRAVELRIGEYEGKSNELALSEFVTKIEALRANQHRQQLELDQPADVRYRGIVAPEQER